MLGLCGPNLGFGPLTESGKHASGNRANGKRTRGKRASGKRAGMSTFTEVMQRGYS